MLEALRQAAKTPDFDRNRVLGIGVDTTGSTPLPVDASGQALALVRRFQNDPHAMAWLWKDHTSHAQAERITQLASEHRPHYLAKCGGRYSSEWFWAKIAQCALVSPEVSKAAYSWVEIADWIPAVLTGTTAPSQLKRGVCAAGHKAFYNGDWQGFPDPEFLEMIHPELRAFERRSPSIVPPSPNRRADSAKSGPTGSVCVREFQWPWVRSTLIWGPWAPASPTARS